MRDQLAALAASELLRLLKELREAAHRQEWHRAIDKCQEARIRLIGLKDHPALSDEERTQAETDVPNLQLVLRYLEQSRLRASDPPPGISEQKAKILDRITDVITLMKARIERAIWED